MKKLVTFTALILILSSGLYFMTKQLEKAQGFAGNNVLTLYNWGDYIDPDLIKKFEKEC